MNNHLLHSKFLVWKNVFQHFLLSCLLGFKIKDVWRQSITVWSVSLSWLRAIWSNPFGANSVTWVKKVCNCSVTLAEWLTSSLLIAIKICDSSGFCPFLSLVMTLRKDLLLLWADSEKCASCILSQASKLLVIVSLLLDHNLFVLYVSCHLIFEQCS